MCSTRSDELMQRVAMAREGEEARDAFKIIVDRYTIEMRGRIAHWLSKLLPGASTARDCERSGRSWVSRAGKSQKSSTTFMRTSGIGEGDDVIHPIFRRVRRHSRDHHSLPP